MKEMVKPAVNKYVKMGLSLLLSVVIICFIYRKIQFDELVSVMSDMRLGYFLLYIFFLLLQLLMAAGRWKMIMSRIGNIDLSYFKNMSLVIGSYSANLVIPGKMGEVVRVVWMRHYHPALNTIGLVIVEKIWDIFSLIIIFFIAVIWLNISNSGFQLPLYISSTIMVTIVFAYIYRYRLIQLTEKFPVFIKEKLKLKEIGAGLIKIMERQHVILPGLLFYSLLLWIVQVSQFYFMFACFDIFIPLPDLFAGSSLAVLAGAIIISIGGIGPRDAVILWFFGSYAPAEILISVGILSILRVVLPAFAGLPFFYHQTRKTL